MLEHAHCSMLISSWSQSVEQVHFGHIYLRPRQQRAAIAEGENSNLLFTFEHNVCSLYAQISEVRLFVSYLYVSPAVNKSLKLPLALP